MSIIDRLGNWRKLEEDPRFFQLTPDERRIVKRRWFSQNVPEGELTSLPEAGQSAVRKFFELEPVTAGDYAKRGLGTFTSSLAKTAIGIPRLAAQAVESVPGFASKTPESLRVGKLETPEPLPPTPAAKIADFLESKQEQVTRTIEKRFGGELGPRGTAERIVPELAASILELTVPFSKVSKLAKTVGIGNKAVRTATKLLDVATKITNRAEREVAVKLAEKAVRAATVRATAKRAAAESAVIFPPYELARHRREEAPEALTTAAIATAAAPVVSIAASKIGDSFKRIFRRQLDETKVNITPEDIAAAMGARPGRVSGPRKLKEAPAIIDVETIPIDDTALATTRAGQMMRGQQFQGPFPVREPLALRPRRPRGIAGELPAAPEQPLLPFGQTLQPETGPLVSIPAQLGRPFREPSVTQKFLSGRTQKSFDWDALETSIAEARPIGPSARLRINEIVGNLPDDVQRMIKDEQRVAVAIPGPKPDLPTKVEFPPMERFDREEMIARTSQEAGFSRNEALSHWADLDGLHPEEMIDSMNVLGANLNPDVGRDRAAARGFVAWVVKQIETRPAKKTPSELSNDRARIMSQLDPTIEFPKEAPLRINLLRSIRDIPRNESIVPEMTPGKIAEIGGVEAIRDVQQVGLHPIQLRLAAINRGLTAVQETDGGWRLNTFGGPLRFADDESFRSYITSLPETLNNLDDLFIDSLPTPPSMPPIRVSTPRGDIEINPIPIQQALAAETFTQRSLPMEPWEAPKFSESVIRDQIPFTFEPHIREIQLFLGQHGATKFEHIGTGTNMEVFDIGGGDVIKIGMSGQDRFREFALPGVLYPKYELQLSGGKILQIVKKVEIRDFTDYTWGDPWSDVKGLERMLESRGVWWGDPSRRNIGYLDDGTPLIIDEGIMYRMDERFGAPPRMVQRDLPGMDPAIHSLRSGPPVGIPRFIEGGIDEIIKAKPTEVSGFVQQILPGMEDLEVVAPPRIIKEPKELQKFGIKDSVVFQLDRIARRFEREVSGIVTETGDVVGAKPGFPGNVFTPAAKSGINLHVHPDNTLSSTVPSLGDFHSAYAAGDFRNILSVGRAVLEFRPPGAWTAENRRVLDYLASNTRRLYDNIYDGLIGRFRGLFNEQNIHIERNTLKSYIDEHMKLLNSAFRASGGIGKMEVEILRYPDEPLQLSLPLKSVYKGRQQDLIKKRSEYWSPLTPGGRLHPGISEDLWDKWRKSRKLGKQQPRLVALPDHVEPMGVGSSIPDPRKVADFIKQAPPSPPVSPGGQAPIGPQQPPPKLKSSLLKRLFQPKLGWMAAIDRKFGSDLGGKVYSPLALARDRSNHHAWVFKDKLNKILKGVGNAKDKSLKTWLDLKAGAETAEYYRDQAASLGDLANEARLEAFRILYETRASQHVTSNNITLGDLQTLVRLKAEIADPLYNVFGLGQIPGLGRFQHYAPNVRPQGTYQDFLSYHAQIAKGSGLPSGNFTFPAEYHRTGYMANVEPSLIRSFNKYITWGFDKKYVKPVFQDALRYIDTLKYDTDTAKGVKLFLGAIKRMPSEDEEALTESIKDFMGTLFGNKLVKKMTFGKLTSKPDTFDNFVDTWILASYAAGMGANVGLTLRNVVLGLGTQIYPVMGNKLLRGLEVLSDGALRQRIRDIPGVINKGLDLPIDLRDGGWLVKLIGVASKTTLGMYQLSESMLRMLTASSAIKDIEPWLARGANVDTLMRRTNLSFLVPSEGKMVLEAYNVGRNKEAADLYARAMSNALNFDYSTAARPDIMRPQLGKLAFQYGTFPSWYSSAAAQSMRNVHPDPTIGKLQRSARMVRWAIAMYGTYKVFDALGMDFTKWLWLAPFTYSGSPLLRTAQDVMDFSGGGWESDLISYKVGSRAVPTLLPVPGFGAARTYYKAVEPFQKGGYGEAVAAALGVRKRKRN